ncbi:MAG TPA: plastocyanin/azurin family copper-binding protein [Actinomycetota bacterium]|nr:plastocyanin/azurin family copper-binding protein [Actinomycetota bacterium]
MARKVFFVWALVLAFALLGAACGGDDDDATGGGDVDGQGDGDGQEVAATTEDYSISLDPTSVASGETTFNITNDGAVLHEFVVFKTDLAEGDLPVDDEGTIDEEGGLEVVDEVEDMEAGSTHELTVDLDAGTYVIACNIPTHYGLGMVTTLTVE